MNFQKIFEKHGKTLMILQKHMENNNELLMTEEEYSIAYQKIKEDITRDKTRVDFPVAIVLGGQPGAGKSNIYQIARKRFSNNLVELDCDAFRAYHPYYEQIKIMFGKEAVIDFCLCNAFKYIWRWKNKNGEEDLEKARWYLHKADSYIDTKDFQDDAIEHMNDYIIKIKKAIKEEENK